jgi:hypothetical protein
MKKSKQCDGVRNGVWLAVTMLALLTCLLQHASGSSYYALTTQYFAPIESPLVILKNGGNGTGTVYANSTNAKISINATSTQLTYNYSLDIVNNDASSWEVRLERLDSTNIDRINTTIILQNDSTSSEQITVNNGSLSQSNNYYELASNTTIHIGVMNLVRDSEGTTILNVFLRIRTPNTTTYTLYTIMFEFM